MTDDVTVWHLGAMHPFEQALTLLLAFGPFVVLGVVVVLRRRADLREEGGAAAGPAEPDAQPDPQRDR